MYYAETEPIILRSIFFSNLRNIGYLEGLRLLEDLLRTITYNRYIWTRPGAVKYWIIQSKSPTYLHCLYGSIPNFWYIIRAHNEYMLNMLYFEADRVKWDCVGSSYRS